MCITAVILILDENKVYILLPGSWVFVNFVIQPMCSSFISLLVMVALFSVKVYYNELYLFLVFSIVCRGSCIYRSTVLFFFAAADYDNKKRFTSSYFLALLIIV